MPRWVLGCPGCSQEFTHSEIEMEHGKAVLDPFAWLLDKPVLPDAGVKLECPHCQKVSVYKRYQLTYRAT